MRLGLILSLKLGEFLHWPNMLWIEEVSKQFLYFCLESESICHQNLEKVQFEPVKSILMRKFEKEIKLSNLSGPIVLC